MILVRTWNAFWFARTSAAPLGLFRIVFGILVFLYGLLLFPDRELWFSDRGWLPLPVSDLYNFYMTPGPRPLQLLHAHWSAPALTAFFVAFLLAALCLSAGLFTRFSSVWVWVCLNSLHSRDAVINNSGDIIMVVLSTLLVLAPAGAACSLDRLWRIWTGRENAAPARIVPWVQRLMQIQISVVYCSTLWAKLPGEYWQNGTAVYYAVRLPELTRFPLPPVANGYLPVIRLLTYSSMLTEFSMAFLVWLPRLRLPVLMAAVLLHLGIEYAMNIPLFSFIMIGSYLLFLRQEDLDWVVAWVHRKFGAARVRLVFDGECDFCRSALLIVRYFDALGLVTFLDYHQSEELAQAPDVRFEDAEQAAIAVDHRGRQAHGFYAFRALAWRLPAVWFVIPLLYIPGIPWLGQRAYRWIARNRSRLPVAPSVAKRATVKV